MGHAVLQRQRDRATDVVAEHFVDLRLVSSHARAVGKVDDGRHVHVVASSQVQQTGHATEPASALAAAELA
ncbi:MAG: hypothetical protein ACRDV2_06310, partial [Actinomycetes bacterium]